MLLSPRALALLLHACLACGGPRSAEPATLVFASASLTDAFEELARTFEAEHEGARIELNCAGTPRLVVQLREGAPADVFASADEASMERVLGFAEALGAPTVFARNRLAVVVPADNPRGVRGIEDLARADLKVALCGPEVPAGRYARQALASAGIAVVPVSDEPSVRAVLAKVHLGEVDAGIVYATDAASAGERVETLSFPPEHDVVARDPIVALAAGRTPDTARAFVAFVTSERGAAILRRHGFETP